jgi:hypothetical protein
MIAVSDINNVVYSQWGIKCIDIDDMKNCIMVRKNASYDSVTGFNAEAVDEAVKTALMKPSLKGGLFDEKTWQIISLCCFAAIVIGCVVIYQRVGQVDTHVVATFNNLNQLINITTVGG